MPRSKDEPARTTAVKPSSDCRILFSDTPSDLRIEYDDNKKLVKEQSEQIDFRGSVAYFKFIEAAHSWTGYLLQYNYVGDAYFYQGQLPNLSPSLFAQAQSTWEGFYRADPSGLDARDFQSTDE